jgi:predicted phosphodiesterase
MWLVMADLHIPYHELTPIESAIKRAQYESAIGVLLLGDFMDCASLSYWQSDRKRDFNKEVEDSIQALDWIRQELPDAQIVYKPGNHEYRLPRLFASKAPELIESPLMAWETVMGFEERGIEFLDYNQIVNAGKLPLIHGHEVRTISKAVNAARGLFLKTKSWSLCAHCHSTSQHTTRTIRKDMVTTWSIGCLCDLEPDYSPIGNDWNWGFALIQVEKNGGFEVRNFRILQSGKVV